LITSYLVYLLFIRRENAKRDAKAAEGILEYMAGEQGMGMATGVSIDSGVTDARDKAFRYST